MKKKKGRFSRFLNPTIIIVDLLIIIIIISTLSSAGHLLLLLLSFSWILISMFTRFYQVYRFTPEIKIFTERTSRNNRDREVKIIVLEVY